MCVSSNIVWRFFARALIQLMNLSLSTYSISEHLANSLKEEYSSSFTISFARLNARRALSNCLFFYNDLAVLSISEWNDCRGVLSRLDDKIIAKAASNDKSFCSWRRRPSRWSWVRISPSRSFFFGGPSCNIFEVHRALNLQELIRLSSSWTVSVESLCSVWWVMTASCRSMLKF